MPVELQTVTLQVAGSSPAIAFRDVAQMVEQAFHQTLVAGARARSSVVEQPPFKRCVVGSIPTGHTRRNE